MSIQNLVNSKAEILEQLGVPSSAFPKIIAYMELLWASNEELNLISRKMTIEELLDNHVIDCLLPLKFFPTNLKSVADFGSGGGLPAVLYAICFPAVIFHLYEKSPKKQEFLWKCQRIASNIHVHGEIPVDLADIQLVTARGFKSVDVILDVSRSYYKRGGTYFLLKARMEKIQEELQLAQKKFKPVHFDIHQLRSPVLEVERHLVLINLKAE